MIYIINLPMQNPTIINSLMTWISSEFPHGISALAGLIIGAVITYVVQSKLKNYDLTVSSLNAAHFISLILIQERASLKGIDDFIQQRNASQPHQKVVLEPIILNINQDRIEKILMNKEFYKHDFAHTIQSLTSTEQSYRKCFELIKNYNQSVQKLLEIQASTQRATMSLLEDGYRSEIKSYVDNIKETYEDAVKLNENTKNAFDILCQNVFSSEYKKLTSDKIVKATELLSINE